MIPLEFIVPTAGKESVQKSANIPGGQQIVLPGAIYYLVEWELRVKNYIFQQACENNGALLVFLTIQVSDYTLIKVRCHSAITALQYTLEGSSFGYLKGHGCLPLFQSTYTLQYIPEGEHQVLFAPGTYHYLYINPGGLIDSLAEHDDGIGKLIKRHQGCHESGELAGRLPFDSKVTELLNRLKDLTDKKTRIPFIINTIVNDLTYHYYEQLHDPILAANEAGLNARLNAFIANHIELPIREIIKKLKKDFFIENRSLLNYWKKSYTKNLMVSLKTLRMHFALYLLVVEKLSIAEVARRLSYSDPYVFSRLFTRFYKAPPKSAQKIVVV
ncbi:AraC family transcriptional regulator [Niabella pedocola]|uniref:AraC family transcriptional regulator n=1 Tax=Niabella pedocola TaxID=1752077 RepID=A0ABS8PTI9_9BACT|nr:AraC family transcriptional regulator [Niabella pedocola]MCD2424395.1 AraC family transcriptional regulator [Niabella pedocola]